jgi:hypothetical protein
MHNQDKQGVREIFVNDENGTPQKHRVVSQDAIFNRPRLNSTLKSQGALCAKLNTTPNAKNVTGFHWIAHPKHIPLDQWNMIRRLLFNIYDEDHLRRAAVSRRSSLMSAPHPCSGALLRFASGIGCAAYGARDLLCAALLHACHRSQQRTASRDYTTVSPISSPVQWAGSRCSFEGADCYYGLAP